MKKSLYEFPHLGNGKQDVKKALIFIVSGSYNSFSKKLIDSLTQTIHIGLLILTKTKEIQHHLWTHIIFSDKSTCYSFVLRDISALFSPILFSGRKLS